MVDLQKTDNYNALEMAALHIGPSTYDDIYMNMDLPDHMLPRLGLSQVNGGWLVKDPGLPNGMGWVDNADFERLYTYKGDHNDVLAGFVPVKRIDDAWE